MVGAQTVFAVLFLYVNNLIAKKIKNKNMETTQSSPQPQTWQASPSEMEFDISRTFTLLMVTLILPMYLALSVLNYSMAAIY